MDKNTENKNYIVEVLFKDGTTMEWRTGKVDTDGIGLTSQNNCYVFKNDRGGETYIAVDEVVAISTYIDTSEEVKLPTGTVVTSMENLAHIRNNRSILQKSIMHYK